MPTRTSPRLTLVLGGARSGKSAFAERRIGDAPPPWIYIATAEPFDEEMSERIAEHRSRRDARWSTIDCNLDLVAMLKRPETAAGAVLVDCLTLWLSNVLLAGRDVSAETEMLLATLAAVRGPIVLVSNEVGFGIVPDNALARRFRDAQGRLNQGIAALADEVVLVVAGLPLVLKYSPHTESPRA